MRKLIAIASRFSQWARHKGETGLKVHATFVAYHPIVVIGAVALVTIVALGGMLRLTVRNNYEADLPTNDPIVATNAALEEAFGKEDKVIIGIIATDGDLMTPERLTIVRAIVNEAEKLPGAKRVISIVTTPALHGHFSAKGESASGGEETEENEWILETTPLLATTPETPEAMAALRKTIRRDANFYPTLVSANFTGIELIVEVERNYDFQKPINDAVHALQSKYTKNGIRIVATGDSILNHETDTGIERQVQIYFVVSLLISLLVLYRSFRNITRGIVAPLLLIGLGNIWTMGVIGWSGRPLNVITSAIPVLLTAIASSYATRLITKWELAALDTKKSKREITVVMLTSVGEEIFATAITAGFGSATLITFLLTSIREFGVFLAIGCIAEMVLALTFIPAYLMLTKTATAKRSSDVVSIGMRLLPTGRFATEYPWGVVSIACVVMLFAILGSFQLHVGVSWREFFPKYHSVPMTADVLNAKFGSSYYFNVMVVTPDENGVHDPETLEALDAMLAATRARFPESVGSTRSVVDVLRHTNREFHEGENAYNRIPDTSDAVAEMLLASSMATSPGYFSGLVDHEQRTTKAIVLLKDHDITRIETVYRFMDAWAENHFAPSVHVEFGGPAMLWIAQTRYVVEGKVWNVPFSIVTVAFFGLVIYRSLTFGILSVIPLAMATLMTFGLMGWLGIRLNMATAIVTSMSVGFGVDSAFSFLHYFTMPVPNDQSPLEWRIRQAIWGGGRAIVVDTMANALGFLVFLVSDFSPVRNLGWLVAFNITMSAIATFTLIPAIYTIVRGRREEQAFLRAQKEQQKTASEKGDPTPRPLSH